MKGTVKVSEWLPLGCRRGVLALGTSARRRSQLSEDVGAIVADLTQRYREVKRL
jgi:hypothetical protein